MKKSLAFILVISIVAGLLCGMTAFASAETAVETAEQTRLQADIDAAQIAVASQQAGAERSLLEKRLDTLQAKVDSQLYFDNEETSAFNAGMGIPVAADDVTGPYAIFDYDLYVSGTFNHKTYATLSEAFLSKPFTIRQQIKISGDAGAPGAYIYLYGLWAYEPSTKTLRSPNAWGNAASANISADRWYDFVYEYNGSSGKVYVEDVVTGEIVGTLSNATYNFLTSDGIWYMFNDLDKGKLYVGDLYVTQTTALKTARNAVVKAERTKAVEDILSAQSAIDLMDDGEDKQKLSQRLDALGVVDSNSVEMLVLKAQTTKAQADIDAAQTAAAAMEQGDERAQYENTLDALQNSIDISYYYDQNKNNPLASWNMEKAYSEVAGHYNILDFGIENVTGLNHKFLTFGYDFLHNPYVIEQKLSFSEGIGNGYFYLQGLWGVQFANGEVHSTAEWGKSAVSQLTPEEWYNVIYAFDGATGKVSVVNLATGKTEAVVENVVPSDYFSGNGLWYLSDNLGTGKVYIGETIVTEITPLKTARNAVVKAERSLLEADIEYAQLCLNKMSYSADKVALQKRLNRLQSDKLIFENFKIQKLRDGAFCDTAVLSSGKIKVDINAITYNSTNQTPAQLVLVLYDNSNNGRKMLGCSLSAPVVVTYENEQLLSATIDVPDCDVRKLELKILVWSGVGSMMPHYATELSSLRDAYQTTQAEDYSAKSGTVTATEQVITNIKTGDYTCYKNVSFGENGAKSVKAKVSGITTNGKIEIRLDGADGTLVGTIDGLNTSDMNNYDVAQCNIQNVTGTHDVYLVYTEGINMDWFEFSTEKTDEMPYYGAKFEPKGGMIYTGAGQGDYVSLMAMNNTANQNKKPAIITVYDFALGDAWPLYDIHASFPGCIIQLGMSFMVHDYEGLKKVAEGGYDDKIITYARRVKPLPHKIFIRIGYECDGPWNGYDPENYKLAYRRIVDIFRREGVENVAYVWNIAYPSLEVYNAMNYYPGDEYVDWWSYDFWVEQGNSNDPTGFLAEAARHNKPVLVGESSKQYVQFSDAFWDKYFGLIENYPSVKGFQYINWYWNTYGTSDWLWGDGRYTTDERWINRFNTQLSDGRYIGLDASYFNASGLAVEFGHTQEFLNNESPLCGKPWNTQNDNFTTNTGYAYTVENAMYSPYIKNGQHSIKPVDDDYVNVIFTVPEKKGGIIYFNDLNQQPKDVFVGNRKVMSASKASGRIAFTADDVVDGKVTLKIKNVGNDTFMVDVVMLQRISDAAPLAPANLSVTYNDNDGAVLKWDAADGAEYYNVYRNGRPIGITTEPEFEDADTVENAIYSVTSYDLKQGESEMTTKY